MYSVWEDYYREIEDGGGTRMGGKGYQQGSFYNVNRRQFSDEVFVQDGSGQLWRVPYGFPEDMEDGNVAPHEVKKDDKGKNVKIYLVDGGTEKWKYVARGTVNKCVYDAMNDARQALGFGKFTSADASYFSSHPLVDTGGVSRSRVLDVAHAILVPWGFGISKVFLPPNTAMNDRHARFAELMGMNPMAIGDRMTTNEEFLQKLLDGGMDQSSALAFASKFKWEYTNSPQLPAVIMYSFGTAKASVPSTKKGKKDTVVYSGGAAPGSYAGGHAKFYGPRDAIPNGWQIAFQIDRIENLGYDISSLKDIVDVEAGEGEKELDVMACKFNGKTPYQHRGSKGASVPRVYRVSGSTSVSVTRRITTIDIETVIPEARNINKSVKCVICGGDLFQHPTEKDFMACTQCTMDSQRYKYSSYKFCKRHQTRMVLLSYILSTNAKPEYFCPKCMRESGIVDIDSYLEAGGAEEKDMFTQTN